VRVLEHQFREKESARKKKHLWGEKKRLLNELKAKSMFFFLFQGQKVEVSFFRVRVRLNEHVDR